MSFLCSCTRKPRLDEDSFEYCYGNHRKLSEGAVLPGTAPTPRVKRKFPEGVGPPLPLVPSDLEDYVDRKSTEDCRLGPLPEITLTPANDDSNSTSRKSNNASAESDSESDIDEVERTLLSICEQEEAKLYGDRISHCSSTNARRDCSSSDKDISSSSSITTASSLNLIQYDEDTDDDSSSDMFWDNGHDDTRSITSQELEDLLIGNGEEDDEESLLHWDRMYVEEENDIHSKPIIVKEWLKGEMVNSDTYNHDIPEKRCIECDNPASDVIDETMLVDNGIPDEEKYTNKKDGSEMDIIKEGVCLVLETPPPMDAAMNSNSENELHQEAANQCTDVSEQLVTGCEKNNDTSSADEMIEKRDSSKRKTDDQVPATSPSEETMEHGGGIREFKKGRFKITTVSPNNQALDLAQNSNVQDAFVIAVEQQARERLERLSALKRIKPVDMTKLSQQESLDSPPASN